MQNMKDTQKALNDIRKMMNDVGEHTSQLIDKIEKATNKLVKQATLKHLRYERAYLKYGLQEIMLSGQASPAITKLLLPVFKSAIKQLDKDLDHAYQSQAQPDVKISTTLRKK